MLKLNIEFACSIDDTGSSQLDSAQSPAQAGKNKTHEFLQVLAEALHVTYGCRSCANAIRHRAFWVHWHALNLTCDTCEWAGQSTAAALMAREQKSVFSPFSPTKANGSKLQPVLVSTL